MSPVAARSQPISWFADRVEEREALSAVSGPFRIRRLEAGIGAIEPAISILAKVAMALVVRVSRRFRPPLVMPHFNSIKTLATNFGPLQMMPYSIPSTLAPNCRTAGTEPELRTGSAARKALETESGNAFVPCKPPDRRPA